MTIEREILKKLIEKADMKPSEIAKVTGVNNVRLSEWMNGVRNPKLSTIVMISEKLGFDFNYSFCLRKV